MASDNTLTEEEKEAFQKRANTPKSNVILDPEEGEVESFELTSYSTFISEQIPALEMVSERFMRNLHVGLFHLLGCTVKVQVEALKTLPYKDYLSLLSPPLSINLIKVNPMTGNALVVINAELIYTLVDRYFGGTGGFSPKKKAEQEFTAMEQRVVMVFLSEIFLRLKESWSVAMDLDFEFVSTVPKLQFVHVATADDPVVYFEYQLSFESGGGAFQVVMPYSMIEPFRKDLEAVTQYGENLGQDLSKDISRGLDDVNLDLNCNFAEVSLSLGDLLNMSIDDVIPIEKPKSTLVCAQGIPLFKSKLGIFQDHLALKFINWVENESVEKKS